MGALKIAIVGCGTSGLAAAAYLTRDGHDVTLFERFDAPRPLGAGLLLQPTGLACLAALGLDGAAVAQGARIRRLYGRAAKGAVVFDIGYQDLRPHLFGLGIHRGALFNLLHAEALRLGVPVTIAREITDSALDGGKRVLIDRGGGRHGAFDLVVDASGSQSALRARLGQVTFSKPYPYGAVWGVCLDDGQRFGRDSLQQRYDGAGVMIGALAIGKRPEDGRETMAFFWSLPVESYAAWRAEGLAPWRARVCGYWPEMADFVDQFASPDDLTFARYSDVIMRQWHGDRIVFIGDAAHCMSPQLGQGANLGLVDALTLAACLRKAREEGLNAALTAYTNARRRQTHFYQQASRWLTPFFQSDSRAAAWLRDRSFGLLCKTPWVKTEMLRTLGGVKTGIFTHLNPGQWHADYDLRKSQP